jgi:Domain of unknown function (DU1801)
MAELKTKKTNASVDAFLKTVDAERRDDCKALVRIMTEATGAKPKMWGPSIIGFGDYRYTNAAGKGTDWFVTGFSPRKRDLTLYIMLGVQRYPDLLAKLGTHSTSGSCLYIKKLADVDVAVLEQIVNKSVKNLQDIKK